MKCDKIILASGSPRRKELLEQIGIEFQIEVARGEEILYGCTIEEKVENLALSKAREVAAREKGEEKILFIGADTIVEQNGNILGKPATEAEAAAMLNALQGNEHRVITGVALVLSSGGKELSYRTFHGTTRVFVHEMNLEEILSYIKTGDPFDKAGAYGIQGLFGRYIDRIEGDYPTVMGLPIAALYQELKEFER